MGGCAPTPLELCAGDWSFWLDLFDMSLHGPKAARLKVQAMCDALQRCDAVALRHAAHALAGTAATLCLRDLSRRCKELERLAAQPGALDEPLAQASARQQVCDLGRCVDTLDLVHKYLRSLGEFERVALVEEEANGFFELLRHKVVAVDDAVFA